MFICLPFKHEFLLKFQFKIQVKIEIQTIQEKIEIQKKCMAQLFFPAHTHLRCKKWRSEYCNAIALHPMTVVTHAFILDCSLALLQTRRQSLRQTGTRGEWGNLVCASLKPRSNFENSNLGSPVDSRAPRWKAGLLFSQADKRARALTQRHSCELYDSYSSPKLRWR